jgi:FkbM family methyltransferase
MTLTRSVTEVSKRLLGVFPLRDAADHNGSAVVRGARLSFATPAPIWSSAVSLTAHWPPRVRWIHTHDGVLRVRLSGVRGVVSLLALDPAGTVIDEVRVKAGHGPIDVDLVSTPLGLCQTIVFRNARMDGYGSHASIEDVECIDVGPSQDAEGLRAPEGLTLRAIDDWARYYGGEGRSLPERVRAVRYARFDRVKAMPWLEDLKVQIHPNDDLSRALYISGLYEPSTLLTLRRLLHRGGRFIDVGANAGLFAMIASRWVGPRGHVDAFEPSEREFGRLVQHVELNGLRNVFARRLAIGKDSGTAQLRVAPFPNAGHNTLGSSFAYQDVQTERIETVEVTTLDTFTRTEGMTRLDVVKMDIEGSEHAALLGATRVLHDLRPALIVEVSRAALDRCGSSPEQVLQLLRAHRYRIFNIGETADLEPIRLDAPMEDGNLVALPVEAS